MLDRTAGRYTNIGLNSYYLLNSLKRYEPRANVKDRVYFKVFPYHDNYISPSENIPMTHGSFGEFCFWKEEFWKEQASPQIYPRWTDEKCKKPTQ